MSTHSYPTGNAPTHASTYARGEDSDYLSAALLRATVLRNRCHARLYPIGTDVEVVHVHRGLASVRIPGTHLRALVPLVRLDPNN